MISVNLRSWAIPFASIAVGLVLSLPAPAQELPTAKPEDVGVSSAKVEELSKFMQSLVDQGKIAGGVTMMARHGKVVHLKAVGMADREEKKPMRTDAIFRIASMTKPITSVAIMMLYEQGKLGLDDPVSKYIPEFKNPKVLVRVDPLETRPAKREITIRHLLTHTSGLGYPETKDIGAIYEKLGVSCGCATSAASLEENMKRLVSAPLLFDPGDRWEYGLSTDVLGRVVEVVSGVSLDRFCEENIFTPLGMKDTFFRVPGQKRSRLVAAYLPVGGQIRKLKDGEAVKQQREMISGDYPYAGSHRYLSGGGGLCSTANDYMRLCLMFLNRGQLNEVRLLREDTVASMSTNQVGHLPNRFGFGFAVMLETNDIHRQLRGSYNWAGFWSTSFRISPHGDWIVIAMAQVTWQDKVTPTWITKYSDLAAEAVKD